MFSLKQGHNFARAPLTLGRLFHQFARFRETLYAVSLSLTAEGASSAHAGTTSNSDNPSAWN